MSQISVAMKKIEKELQVKEDEAYDNYVFASKHDKAAAPSRKQDWQIAVRDLLAVEEAFYLLKKELTK
jgi:hypothetical protein